MKRNIKQKEFYRKRKDIFKTIIFVIIFFSCLNFTKRAEAASDATFAFDPLTQSYVVGSDFTVDVKVIPGVNGVGNIDLGLIYNQAKLQLTGIGFGGKFTQMVAPSIPGDGTAAVSGQMPLGQQLTQEGVFVTLNFHALAEVSNSPITVNTSVSKIYSDADPGNNQLSVSAITPAQVTVTLPIKYTIGGTITGLRGSLVLQNNGADNLLRSTNNSFTFATAMDSGSTYGVTVLSQPVGQVCMVANGVGTVTSNIDTVIVTCSDIPANTYTVGGTISGISGDTVVLKNNGKDDLTLAANGSFVFDSFLTSGSAYAVTVGIQPDGKNCKINNGSGTIASENITNISVVCENVVSACTSFDYSSWGVCQSDNTQTRTIVNSFPVDCNVGVSPILTQACTYGTTETTTVVTEVKKKSKKSNDSSTKIVNSPKVVTRGKVLVQSGAHFSKNSEVQLFFSKYGGGYYPPKTVKTDSRGKFSIAYLVNKPAGIYKWHAVDVKKGKKIKDVTYRVK